MWGTPPAGHRSRIHRSTVEATHRSPGFEQPAQVTPCFATSGRRRLPGALWCLSVADGRQSVPRRRISGARDTVRVARHRSGVANQRSRVAGHRNDGARLCHPWCGVGDLLCLPGGAPLQMSDQSLPLTVGVSQVVGALVQVIAVPLHVFVAPVQVIAQPLHLRRAPLQMAAWRVPGRRSGVARPRFGVTGRRCAGASHRDHVKTSGQPRGKSSHSCCSSSYCCCS